MSHERDDAAKRNREKFKWQGDVLDLLRANGFPNARIVYAENAAGEIIGRRDFVPATSCPLVDAANGGRPEWRRR